MSLGSATPPGVFQSSHASRLRRSSSNRASTTISSRTRGMTWVWNAYSGSARRCPKVTSIRTHPSPTAAAKRFQPVSMRAPPISSTYGNHDAGKPERPLGKRTRGVGFHEEAPGMLDRAELEHLPETGGEEDEAQDHPCHEHGPTLRCHRLSSPNRARRNLAGGRPVVTGSRRWTTFTLDTRRSNETDDPQRSSGVDVPAQVARLSAQRGHCVRRRAFRRRPRCGRDQERAP